MKREIFICESELQDILAKTFECDKSNIVFEVSNDGRGSNAVSAKIIEQLSFEDFIVRGQNKLLNERNGNDIHSF